MIIIDRKLGGILPYRTIFFPTAGAIAEHTERLMPLRLARLFWTPTAIAEARCLVYDDPGATLCTDLTQKVDQLSAKIGRHNRYRIRIAEKLGDRLSVGCNTDGVQRDFLDLYNRFARSKEGMRPTTRANVQRYLSRGDVHVVYVDGLAMCAHLVLRDSDARRVRVVLAGSRRLDRENERLCSDLNRLLHWRNMLNYKQQSIEVYDWGGIREDPHDGIASFKASFGGELVHEHTYLCANSSRLGRWIRNARLFAGRS